MTVWFPKAAPVLDEWRLRSETSFKTNGCLTLLTLSVSGLSEAACSSFASKGSLTQLALRGDDIYQQRQSLQAHQDATKCADTKLDGTDIGAAAANQTDNEKMLQTWDLRLWLNALPGLKALTGLHLTSSCIGTPPVYWTTLIASASLIEKMRVGWGGELSIFQEVKREKRRTP